MHARNRSPGNGYRAHAMGVGGVATASRVSPESSMRGHGGYNSEYRSYNRGGFARGQSRQFNRPQAPPLPPQKGGDIFMEAGKLAAEYLIAKGLLPANVLSGKWQNGNLKNLVAAQEGGSVQHSVEGRASALSRLGETGADAGPGRRRYTDDYSNSIGSRSSLRGRKRNGSFKNYSSEWNREIGRSGSWSERSRASADGDDDNDVFSRHRDEQQVSNDSDRVSQSSVPELAPASDVLAAQESEIAGDPHSSSEKLKSGDSAGAKDSASPHKKDIGKEAVEKDGPKVSDVEGEKNKDAGKNDEMELQDRKDDSAIMASSDEGSLASENNTDLLRFCRFAKFPTRTRSSMAFRGSRVDTDPMIVNNNTHEGEPSKESVAHVEDLTASNLSGDGLPYQMNDSKAVDLDRPRVPAAENELGPSYALAKGSGAAPTSFLDRISVKDPELPDFGRINTMIMDRGEKRGLDEGNTSMGNKKPRESAPSEDAEPDGCLSLSDPAVKRPILEEQMTSEGRPSILPSDDKRLLDISSYPESNIEPCMEYTEEKRLLPGSFKTCDLNLMEASEANDGQDHDQVILFPSVRDNGKQAISVNVDLSMHNDPRVSSRYGKCSVDGKEIEVIDLENDSIQDDKDLTNSDGRTENVFTGLGGFSSNAPNASEIPDSSDGYGLMISELMGNDIPNCSSVPADVDSLHNDMGLDNGEGILGDDDPIYMSFGEIPLSFFRAWEQPTQEYGKPF